MAKHHQLSKPQIGNFARCEFAFLGTPCGQIKLLFGQIIASLSSEMAIAVVEADHKAEENIKNSLILTDKINFRRLDFQQNLGVYQQKGFFNEIDLVLVNGNHFEANAQIVVIDPAKDLFKKKDKLNNVQLVLLQDGVSDIPDALKEQLSGIKILKISQLNLIIAFLKDFVNSKKPVLKGLVLAGGQSQRMGQDKGLLNYHGQSQRDWAMQLLQPFCQEVYLSVNAQQKNDLQTQHFIEDSFLNMGPTSGILSAFRQDPNAAWLVLACDLPYLDTDILTTLVKSRNPQKVATAFVGDQNFAEPLFAIYEPRAYSILLQMLALGYDCPRKTLINSDIELIETPDKNYFQNINYPNESAQAIHHFSNH